MAPAPSNTITGINLSKVRQSELERMFKVLLQRLTDDSRVSVTSSPDPMDPKFVHFVLRFSSGAEWNVREQVNLARHHTIPDFYAERLDRPGTQPVAIYLDGWEFHGAQPGDTDDDASKRLSLRSAGIRVWTLTYDDVNVALKALGAGLPAGAVAPLPSAVRHQIGAQLGGHEALRTCMELSAVDQLLLALGCPDPDAWRLLAEVSAVAPITGKEPVWVTDFAIAADAAASHSHIEVVDHETNIAAVRWLTTSGCDSVTMLQRRLDGSTATMAILSLNTALSPDRHRWADWHHLANVFQYLDDYAIITTSRTHVPGNIDATSTASPPIQPDTVDLSDIFDHAALVLAQAAIAAGFEDFEIGVSAGDPDDTPLEVRWPAARIAIVAVGVVPPVLADGWRVKPADAWTEAELIEQLKEGRI